MTQPQTATYGDAAKINIAIDPRTNPTKSIACAHVSLVSSKTVFKNSLIMLCYHILKLLSSGFRKKDSFRSSKPVILRLPSIVVNIINMNFSTPRIWNIISSPFNGYVPILIWLTKYRSFVWSAKVSPLFEYLSEAVGFEPTDGSPSLLFKSSAINQTRPHFHSSICKTRTCDILINSQTLYQLS